MRNKILNIFFHALAASKGHILALVFGLAITSCGLEEPYGGLKNNEGVIEFVARPVGFNDQIVDTKATVAEGDLETKIYSCYFLVFDTTTGTGNGKLIHCSDNLVTGTTPITSIPPQRLNISKKGVKTVKACFIVNVPKNFIYNETNDTPLLNNLTALNAAVLGPEHFSYATNSATVPMGTPQMTINGVSGVKCIPAFGMTSSDINLESGAAAPVQITIKRLFAKVSVNLKVALAGLSDFESAIQALTHYEVQTLKLYNIPTKVKLVEDNVTESAWRTATSQYTTTPMQKSRINTQIYNNSDNGYSYYFYVPEFYLDPIADPTQKQEFKPKNYPDSDSYRTYPVYIQIEGSFVKYSINSATINYKIYLGGDNIDNFSIARNTHYTNDLTILNTNKNSQDQNNLDHRVTTTTINNPVAKAGETANCYVISKPGEYHFPAYMGAYKSLEDAIPCEGGDYAKIIKNVAQYKSDQVDKITNINISGEAYDPITNMVSFKVAPVSESINTLKNLVPNGNVVIALMDDNGTTGENEKGDDTIIWSWHLWFVSDFSGNESEWATIGSETYPNGSVVMDRNLGAVSATITLLNQSEAIGAYYKYGRKEPFIDGAYWGGGTNGTNTWDPAGDANVADNTKAINDPCPPGYKIPNMGVWQNFTPTKSHDALLGGFLFYRSGSTSIYYPYSGYIDANDKPQVLSFDIDRSTKSDLIESKIPEKQNPYYSLNILDERPEYPYKDIKVEYYILNNDHGGYMWSNLNSGNNILKYGYKEEGFQIFKCTYTQGVWDVSGRFVKTYKANYTGKTPTVISDKQLDDGTTYSADQALKDSNAELYERVNKLIQAKHSNKEWWDILGVVDLFTKKTYLDPAPAESNCGYPIRCVVE